MTERRGQWIAREGGVDVPARPGNREVLVPSSDHALKLNELAAVVVDPESAARKE